MFCAVSSFFVPNTYHAVLSALSWAARFLSFSALAAESSSTFWFSEVTRSSSSAILMSLASSCARSSAISRAFSSSWALKPAAISSMVLFILALVWLLLRSCCCRLAISSRLRRRVRWMKFMFSTIACLLFAPPSVVSTPTRPSASLIWRKPSWIWSIMPMRSFDSFCVWLITCCSESITAALAS